MAYVISVIAIVICGGAGALLAWLLVSALGWTGIAGALAMAVVGMVAATLLYAAGVALRRALRLHK